LDAELCKEHRAQVVVEVLPGVDQHLVVRATQRHRQRRRLDELRAVADDGENLHAGSSIKRPDEPAIVNSRRAPT